MQCSKCGSDNRPGARFCNDCASPLSTQCPSCCAFSQPGAKFYDECRTALFQAAAVTISGAASLGGSAIGERRHLTVLFCDLVNSTNIAAQLDPEEWREVVASYHRVTARVIERFGGYVAKYLGDGIMAYFGWPEAYGDDAERAVRRGWRFLKEYPTKQATNAFQLSVRVGVDSGVVVVGTGGGKEIDVFGETPNIAARLHTAAASDTVLITAATHRLVSGLFVVEQRGAHTLKGIEQPIQLYQVVQPSGVRGRLEGLRPEGRSDSPAASQFKLVLALQYTCRLASRRWPLCGRPERSEGSRRGRSSFAALRTAKRRLGLARNDSVT